MAIQLLTVPETASRLGIAKSTLYWWAANGLMTAPLKIGHRAARIPSSDADAIAAARIAGQSDSQIRDLVARLHAERATALDRLRPDLAEVA